MNMNIEFVLCIFVVSSAFVVGVPPEACFANFRWDDCGKPPVPVMYYWKPGSRCEVGMWRGCLPNANMFPDEYTCINTCIFVERAGPNDYEELKVPEPDYTVQDPFDYTTVGFGNVTTNETVVGNSTDSGANTTDVDSTTVISDSSNASAVEGSPSAPDAAEKPEGEAPAEGEEQPAAE